MHKSCETFPLQNPNGNGACSIRPISTCGDTAVSGAPWNPCSRLLWYVQWRNCNHRNQQQFHVFLHQFRFKKSKFVHYISEYLRYRENYHKSQIKHTHNPFHNIRQIWRGWVPVRPSISLVWYTPSEQIDTIDWTNRKIQWNLFVTTTSKIKSITCDLFSNVF